MRISTQCPYNYGRDRPIVNPKILSEVYRPRSYDNLVHFNKDSHASKQLSLPHTGPQNHDCTFTSSLLPNAHDNNEAPLTDSLAALEMLRIFGLISESRKSNLASHMLEPSIPCENASKVEPQENSEGPAFLPKFWRFPLNARCHKSTCGALHTLSQPKFETMVSAGYILENGKGFRWTANDRYLLFKDTASASYTSSPALTNTGLPHHLFFQSTKSLQTRLRTIPRISQAPTFSPSFRFPQWSFDPNSLWKESFPSAILPYANNLQIECSVNAGYLITDATSIRDAENNACILEYAGQRPDGEGLHADRIILAEKMEVPTPIVERGERGAFYGYRKGNKGVLFDEICATLDASGVVEFAKVVDNEGKTDLIYGVWPKTLQRRVIVRKGRKYILEN